MKKTQPTQRRDVAAVVRLTREEAREIDQVRGQVPRERYARDVLMQAIRQQAKRGAKGRS